MRRWGRGGGGGAGLFEVIPIYEMVSFFYVKIEFGMGGGIICVCVIL